MTLLKVLTQTWSSPGDHDTRLTVACD